MNIKFLLFLGQFLCFNDFSALFRCNFITEADVMEISINIFMKQAITVYFINFVYVSRLFSGLGKRIVDLWTLGFCLFHFVAVL